MKINPRTRGFVAGKTQVGKTFFVKSIIKSTKRYIIYDTKHQYGGFGMLVRSLEQLKTAIFNRCTRVVYQPENYSTEHFDKICEFIRFNLQNFLFVIEEIQVYVSKGIMPDNFQYIITAMEEKGVGILATSQRPQAVHNDFLGNLSWCQCFRICLYADAVAMSKIVRVSVDDLLKLRDYWSYNFNDKAEIGKEVILCPPISI
jgi:hypothetical protein